MKINMKKFFNRFWSVLKLKKVYIPLIAIILIIVLYKSFSSNSSTETIITLAPSTFVQEVSVTGKVQAANNVDMGFEAVGRVSNVNAKVGQQVKKGDLLVSLANGDAYGTVLQRQANLSDIANGARKEDISIAESDVQSAQSTLDQNTQALIDKIKEVYSVTDDAIKTKADQLFTNPRTVNPEVIVFNNGRDDYFNLKISIGAKRVKVGENLSTLSSKISALSASSLTSDYVSQTRETLNLVKSLLDDLSMVASSVQVNTGVSQLTIDGYKNSISSARTTVNAVSLGLTTAEQGYNVSKSGLERAKQQLALKKAGSTSDEIKAAQAQLQSAQAILAKTLIVAPFDGIVTKMDAKEGESVNLGSTYVSMISAANFEVESYVSESDIAKVKVGQPARITLDTYGKDVIFPAVVYEVDPAETVVDGVTTYKIKLSFNQSDERIKSGMTSNITIETSNKPSTFVIPQEALFLNAGEKMVTVDQGGNRINKKVETGGLNANGEIEIISGLVSGEKIVVKNK
jgi:RND family efflux transporter MFP subunit